MRAALVLLTLAACGRIGIDARPVDAGEGPPTGDAPMGTPDGPAATPCGTTVLLDDAFDDGTPAPGFSATPKTGLTVSEVGGAVEVAFAAMVSAENYAFYASQTYPTEGLCVTIEVSAVPANGGAAYFKVRSPPFELELYTFNGFVDLRIRESNTVTVLRTIPLDLVNNRFWRIGHAAGRSSWETSADGVDFAVRASLDGFFTPTSCNLEFGAGTNIDVVNAGVARYEHVIIHGP